MKVLFVSIIAMLVVLSSCEKNPVLSDAPFDFSFVRISGSDESSFNVSFKSQAKANISDVYQDDSGNYLITGSFISSIRSASNELFLMKLSPLGDLIWSKKFQEYSYLRNLRFLTRGNQAYSIVGQVEQNLDQAGGYVQKALILEFDEDGNLTSNIYMDSNGIIPWLNSADAAGENITFVARDGASSDDLTKLKRFNRGSGFLVWEVEAPMQVNALASTIDEGELALEVDFSQSNGFPDWFIQKFSSSGDSLWIINIDNSQSSTITIGEISSAENGDFILPIYSGFPSSNDEIRKYDASGNLVWTHTVNNELIPRVASIRSEYYFYLSNTGDQINLNKLDVNSGQLQWTKALPYNMNYSWKALSASDEGVLVLISGINTMVNTLFKYDSMGN
jgi:hypothetical protein